MMSMSMSMGMSMVQRQAQKLSMGQRQAIVMSQRLSVLGAVWGRELDDRFNIRERCGACEQRLSLEEILKGFSNDPTDTLSKCPKCRVRFQPRLVGRDTGIGQVELAFYCPSQTLHALKGEQGRSFHELANSAHGRSAMIHFGSIYEAFKQIGVKYDRVPSRGWQDRIRPFLGKVSDRTIAAVVGCSKSTIGRIRREAGIRAFEGLS